MNKTIDIEWRIFLYFKLLNIILLLSRKKQLIQSTSINIEYTADLS